MHQLLWIVELMSKRFRILKKETDYLLITPLTEYSALINFQEIVDFLKQKTIMMSSSYKLLQAPAGSNEVTHVEEQERERSRRRAFNAIDIKVIGDH